MTTLREFRAQFPQYNDMTDQELTDSLYTKKYSDMPREDFNRMIGYQPVQSQGGPLGAVGHGLAAGTIGLAGLPGDVASLAVTGASKAAGVLGASPETQQSIADFRKKIPLGGSASVANIVQGTTGYKPLTEEQILAMPTPEKYLFHGAEMVPGAAVLGSGGTVKGAIKAGIGYGLIPGAGGEAAVQFTGAEGTPDEWWIRTLGAVGTGLGAAGLSQTAKWATMAKEPGFKAIADKGLKLEGDARRLYGVVDNSGIKIDPISLQALAARVQSAVLRDTRQFENLPTATQKAIKDLQALSNRPLSFTALDDIRQSLRDSVVATEPKTSYFAQVMTKQLDDYVRSLGPQDMISGASPAATVQALTQARDLWGRAAAYQQKAQIIGDIWNKSLDKVGANYTKAGIQTAVRQGFRALNDRLRADPELAHQFTATERMAIDAVVRGGPIENALRKIGSFAPVSPSGFAIDSAIGAPSAAAGYAMTGTAEGAAVAGLLPTVLGAVVGGPARVSSNVMQREGINKLIATILNEGRPVKMPPTSAFSPAMPLLYGAAARRAPTAAEMAKALLEGQPTPQPSR